MPSPEPALQLFLSVDRETFTIGDSIRLRLRIHNPTSTAAELRTIVWDDEVLAFTPPTIAELLAPDGRDLLAPYVRPAIVTHGEVWRIEAGRDEYFQLPVTSHLALRQPGEYRFSLKLAGSPHASGSLVFRLVDVESSLPTGSVELLLALGAPRIRAGKTVQAVASFVNRSSDRLVFLRPQEDSFDGWVNPSYLFRVTDANGRGVPRAVRCGDLATPVYDEASFSTVEPGGSGTQTLRIADYPGLETPGTYRIGLTYIARRHAVGVGGVAIDRETHWPTGTFLGRLESNEATLVVR